MHCRRLWAIPIVVTCAACGWSSRTPSQAAVPVPIRPHALTRSNLTPAETKYGRAPQRDPSVVYERDVVLVDRGPEAIRSVSPDQLTWTIDARAPHVDELSVGKIAFITGRCVGRVLKLTPDGDTVRLVLGPVVLTDIFQALDVTFDEPIDLEQSLEYPVQEFDGVTWPLEGEAADFPDWSATFSGGAPGLASSMARRPLFRVIPAAFDQSRGGPVAPGIPQALDLGFRTSPLKTGDGIGAELRHEGNGIRVVAQAQLRVAKPTVDFHLSIHEKTVEAKLILHNMTGLRLRFDVSAGPDFAGNVDWYVPVPPPLSNFSIPLAGPVPLSMNVRQEIWVRTGFASKSSSFSAGGDYDLNEDVGFTYHDDNWDLIGPKSLTVKQSLMVNMGGVSLTPTALVITHRATLTGGLGAGGFTAGPTMVLGTSLQTKQGSSIGAVLCHGASIAMKIRGGLGYSIPQPIEKLIDLLFTLIQVPPIQREGGVYTDWKELINQEAKTDSPICK